MAKFDRYCKILYGSNPPTLQSSATLFEKQAMSPTSRQQSFNLQMNPSAENVKSNHS